jgi:hypothetical protein
VTDCLITGNEDGVKHCAMNILYSLQEAKLGILSAIIAAPALTWLIFRVRPCCRPSCRSAPCSAPPGSPKTSAPPTSAGFLTRRLLHHRPHALRQL